MEESICCGAVRLWDTDLCSQCGEWSEFEEVDNSDDHFFNERVKQCINNFKNNNNENV